MSARGLVYLVVSALCTTATVGCGRARIQGRCVQGSLCTEYYRKTRPELNAVRGVCRVFTADRGWFEDGSHCPTEGLVGRCHVRGDGDLEIVHYYGRSEQEARDDCSERGGSFEAGP